MTWQMKPQAAMQLKIAADISHFPAHKAACSTKTVQESLLAPSECVIHVQPSGLLPHAYVSVRAKVCGLLRCLTPSGYLYSM